MGHGTGVTAKRRADGEWVVRWRERVPDDTEKGWKWASRQRVISKEVDAQRLADKIRRSMELGELPDLEPVRVVPAVATVDDILEGYLDSLAVRLSPGSVNAYTSDVARILKLLREMGKLGEDPVPGTMLTRDAVIRLTAAHQAMEVGADGNRRHLAESTVYRSVRLLVAAWVWACDDPTTYPGLQPAPRDARAVLPRAAVYGGTVAPTIEEADACLRHIAALPRAAHIALSVATIASRTGLRTAQVFGLLVGDVNLTAGTLLVRGGKTRREKAEQRTVPFAPALRDTLAELVAGRPDDAPLVARRGRSSSPATVAIGAGWKAATKAGEARQEAWDPQNRVNARPRHAFRAAFVAYLRQAGVDRSVVMYLVGHALEVQETHYLGDGIMKLARDAVALLPAIDWQVREAMPDNVHQLRGA